MLVDEAVAQQGIYNTYRVANPKRNTYVSRNSAEGQSRKNRKRDDQPTAPTLNATVLAAAALLAEHSAALENANGTLHKIYNQPKTLKRSDVHSKLEKRGSPNYWVANITHTGHAPMGSSDSYLIEEEIKDSIGIGGRF